MKANTKITKKLKAKVAEVFYSCFSLRSRRALVRYEAHNNQWVKIPPWQFAVHHEDMGRLCLATDTIKLPYQCRSIGRDGKQAAVMASKRSDAVDDPSRGVGSLLLTVL